MHSPSKSHQLLDGNFESDSAKVNHTGKVNQMRIGNSSAELSWSRNLPTPLSESTASELRPSHPRSTRLENTPTWKVAQQCDSKTIGVAFMALSMVRLQSGFIPEIAAD
jgi:hypothetical protein